MFKYNELSDLKNGSLVTPLSISDDGTILCLTEDGQKVYHLFDDFDFLKKIEDRKPIEPEPTPEPTPVPKPTIKDVIDQMAEDEDDSLYDGTDDTEIFDDSEVSPEPVPVVKEKEGFVSKEKIPEILDRFDYKKKSANCKIWRDVTSTRQKKTANKVKGKSFKDEQGSIYTFNKDATSVDMTYSAGVANFNVIWDDKTITLEPTNYIYSEETVIYKYTQTIYGFNLLRIGSDINYPSNIILKRIKGGV